MRNFENFVFILICLHAILMFFDEFLFHRKRILPRWERIGHPFDTLFILACFFLVIFFPMTLKTISIYIIISIISSVIIIKDEPIHLKYCSKYEQILHAFLFILHPVILISLFLSWPSFTKSYFLILENFHSLFLKYLIYFHFISATIFFFYQIIFWNFIFKETQYVSKRNDK